MGAKYYPTIRDQKASQRFHQKLKPIPQAKPKPTQPVAKSPEKK